ncbi:MAG: DUF1835 domain-containing protein [Pyrinomonadaceae bacterium]
MKIHVLPGDAVAESFNESDIEGEIIICRECLIEGDLQAGSLDDFWRVRAEFINEVYSGDESSYLQNVAGEFEKMRKNAEGGEVNLWFEYELFCQVNMWFCLFLLSEKETVIYRVAPVVRSETEIWKGFGRLEKEDLQKCFGQRIKFTEADILLGKNLWKAYQNKDFDGLRKLSLIDSECFPKLKEVCAAEIEKQTRPKKTLEKIISAGETDFGRIFEKFASVEGVYGFGDAQVKRILQEM